MSARKPPTFCQQCGLCRVCGTGPCDECGATDFKAEADPTSHEARGRAYVEALNNTPLAASDSKTEAATELTALDAAFEIEIEEIAPDMRAPFYYLWRRMKERVEK